jgi:hypothetical protein
MAKHESKSVVFVDAQGRHLKARTLGEPGADGKVQLLVSYGRGGMGMVEACESGAKAAGTWHHPDQPS